MKPQNKIHRIFLRIDFNKTKYVCPSDISHRILNVLRIKESEKLVIFNHKKEQCYASIKKENKKVIIIIENQFKDNQSMLKNIHLSVSVINMKNMDLIIQKAAELGVNEFYPIYTKRSQYSDVSKKIIHWDKISVHASEQCSRIDIMKIKQPITLSDYISQEDSVNSYVLHQKGTSFSFDELDKKEISILVGPEGGFDTSELELLKESDWKFKNISQNILRTETACISALSIINNYEGLSRHNI